MKRLLLFPLLLLVALTFAGAVSAAPPAAPAIPLRVLLLNIRHGSGDDGTLQLEALVRFLKSQAADVIVLNEVQRRRSESSYVDEAFYLRRSLGFETAVGMNANLWPSGHGSVLLSRFPIVDIRRTYLPGGGEQRGLLEAGLNVQGHRLTVVMTHLAPAKDARKVQATYIGRRLSELEGPRILVGDLNAPPDEESVALLSKRIGGPGPAGTPTYPASRPTVRADYILADGNFKVRSEQVPPVLVSDHLPVVVDLEFVAPAPAAYEPGFHPKTVDLTQLPTVPHVALLLDPAARTNSVSLSRRRNESGTWGTGYALTLAAPAGVLGFDWSDKRGTLSWSHRIATGDLLDMDSYHREYGRYYLSAGAAAESGDSGTFSLSLAYSAIPAAGWARQITLGAVRPRTPAPSRSQQVDGAIGFDLQGPSTRALSLRTGVTFSRVTSAHLGVLWEETSQSQWAADLSGNTEGVLRISLTRYF